jgi:hypothetical protein
MIKTLFGALFTFSFWSIISYLLISFAVWELNVNNWSIESRFIMIIFGFIPAIILFFVWIINAKN